jgi:anti-sigma28 factor (negative regulator of flagellin synthesis)
MKRLIILTLAAGMLSAGTPALLAQVSTNAPTQTTGAKPTPQQRKADRARLMKLIGLSGKELKSFTPEERRTKIKDATDQKITELKQEKTSGTLSADGQSDLAFLESHQKHAHKRKSDN